MDVIDVNALWVIGQCLCTKIGFKQVFGTCVDDQITAHKFVGLKVRVKGASCGSFETLDIGSFAVKVQRQTLERHKSLGQIEGIVRRQQNLAINAVVWQQQACVRF